MSSLKSFTRRWCGAICCKAIIEVARPGDNAIAPRSAKVRVRMGGAFQENVALCGDFRPRGVLGLQVGRGRCGFSVPIQHLNCSNAMIGNHVHYDGNHTFVSIGDYSEFK